MRGNHLAHHRATIIGLEGLSPRVRGNLGPPFWEIPPLGSIPARAGEPADGDYWPPFTRVYPRACGGTNGSSAIAISAGKQGLSPRVRGNLQRRGPLAMDRPPVYPRACGGT